ncbi:SDR family oxidoreductase [Micromonospora sp. NPDC048898]|uniref:SDR family oxidoreductase n=1 Tax=Micromonospora sp. NPDC048898 TaxID=3364260 RepID=UPI00371F204D
MTARAILLTGAAGVVGQALLAELTGRPVICLLRRGRLPAAGPEVVTGDISRPSFGLPPEVYESLTRRVGTVIHSAALTEWGRPAEDYEGVNIAGTRHVIDFARVAGASVHYISTAFVAALAGEAPVRLRPDNVTTNYVLSKRASELLLAESGVPHSVYRPTNLIGHSTTGWTSKPQIVQLVADWVGRGRAEVFPAHPGNLIDVVAQDLCAKAVAEAIRRDDVGRQFWLTYGKAAMTVDEAVELLIEHARSTGRRIRIPRIVHPADLDEAELNALPPSSRRFVQVLGDVSEVTAASGGILPSSMSELVEEYGLPEIGDKDAFRRSLLAAAN